MTTLATVANLKTALGEPMAATGDSAPAALVTNVLHKVFTAQTPTNVAANSASVVLLHSLPLKFSITSWWLIPPDVNGGTPLTADDTHYATLALKYNDGAGGSYTAVTGASITTKITAGSGNWAKEVAVTGTGAITPFTVPASSQIALIITKSDGTGVAIPAGTTLVVEGDYVD